MIDNILALTIFDKVASKGSLTEAAKDLGLSLAVVSKRLAALETQMGVRLLNRTTRRQSLTQEGKQFHQHCVKILAEVQHTEDAMQQSRNEITGILRITAARMFGTRYITTLAAAFQALHPELRFELIFSDEVVDIIEDGIDLAFRFGAMHDSSLIARKVAESELVLCASPAYVERHGLPRVPADLARHRCIVYGLRSQREWVFQYKGEPVTAEMNATCLCNDGNAAKALALVGGGIFLKSLWDVGTDLAEGKLVRVLPAYRMPSAPLHVVYAHSQHLAPWVQRFVEFSFEQLRREWEALNLRPWS
jgi:DNA-binding transcriptional LysR family regulator